MKRILWKGPDFCAAEEDGVLTEYLKTDPQDQAGEVVLGKVERMMPGMGCAFVEIGRKKPGFLPLRENSISFRAPQLSSGMKIAVQIRKEEIGAKGAYLTRDLTFPGRTVLLMPVNRYIGVSSRITDETLKKALRETGKEIAAERTGLVMRASAAQAEYREIAEETEQLLRVWREMEQRLRTADRIGEVLYQTDPVRQMINDYQTMGIDEIRESEELPPDLERQRQAARDRKIRIRNGGNIVIDRCEAMTVVDVNTGSAKCAETPAATLLETNLSACETIAAQVRLRNLSGMILIDFIDMERDEERKMVGDKLTEAFSRDRRKTVLHGWTNLGLMEMTRKRTGKG